MDGNNPNNSFNPDNNPYNLRKDGYNPNQYPTQPQGGNVQGQDYYGNQAVNNQNYSGNQPAGGQNYYGSQPTQGGNNYYGGSQPPVQGAENYYGNNQPPVQNNQNYYADSEPIKNQGYYDSSITPAPQSYYGGQQPMQDNNGFYGTPQPMVGEASSKATAPMVVGVVGLILSLLGIILFWGAIGCICTSTVDYGAHSDSYGLLVGYGSAGIFMLCSYGLAIVGLIVSIVGAVMNANQSKTARITGDTSGRGKTTGGMICSIAGLILAALSIISCASCTCIGLIASDSEGFDSYSYSNYYDYDDYDDYV